MSGFERLATMVDLNAPNLITVGLISLGAWAVLNLVMTKTGMKPAWMA